MNTNNMNTNANMYANTNSNMNSNNNMNTNMNMNIQTNKQPTTMQEKMAQQHAMKTTESTLAEYSAFMVDNNWLDETLVDIMMDQQMNDFEDIDDKNLSLDRQIEEWEQEGEFAFS